MASPNVYAIQETVKYLKMLYRLSLSRRTLFGKSRAAFADFVFVDEYFNSSPSKNLLADLYFLRLCGGFFNGFFARMSIW